MKAWLKLFRVQNLITVPGDVLVGSCAFGHWDFSAALAGVFLYMYGLVDNDLVGVRTDPIDRPLVSGAISINAARIARGMCLFAAMMVGSLADLPPEWWICAFALTLAIVAYNRTKFPLLMGLCRGLNVLSGGLAWISAAIWTIYVAAITKYSERETIDPTNSRKVALLVYGIVVMQIIAIVLFLRSCV